jgi:hypothetical protein
VSFIKNHPYSERHQFTQTSNEAPKQTGMAGTPAPLLQPPEKMTVYPMKLTTTQAARIIPKIKF